MNTNYTKEQILKIFGKTPSSNGNDRKLLIDIQLQLGCDTRDNNCKKLAVTSKNETEAINIINNTLNNLLHPRVITDLIGDSIDDDYPTLIDRLRRRLYLYQCVNEGVEDQLVYDCITAKNTNKNSKKFDTIPELNKAIMNASRIATGGRYTRKQKNRKTKYTKKSQKQRRSKTKKTRKN